MRTSLLVALPLFFLVACSGADPVDSGSDSGDTTDSGAEDTDTEDTDTEDTDTEDTDTEDTDTGPVPCINIVTGDVTLTDAAGIAALADVCEITGILTASDLSASVTDLTGLETLEKVGGFVMTSNSGIVDIDALSNVTEITGTVTIRNNSKLGDVNGLESLTKVGGDLALGFQDFADVDGLSSVIEVGGLFNIDNLNSLTDLGGLTLLTTVGGDLQMYQNTSLCKTVVDAYVATVSVAGTVVAKNNNEGC